jgi:hypothetical protein
MRKKPIYKSLTINALLVLLIVLILRTFGIVEVEMGKTYDTIDVPKHTSIVRILEAVAGVAVAVAVYGRVRAEGPIRFRKDKKDAE